MTAGPTAQRPQLDLAGQTFVADGPHDLSGMYVMHHAFRRDLDRFVAATRNTPVAETATWRALARRWHRFGTVLHHHHTIEDTAIWPPLLHRVDAAGDAAARATLEAMEAEHELIDPQLGACSTAFGSMAFAPHPDARARLAEHVAMARDLLVDHLRHEETEALPLVQEHLTAEEWATAEKAAGASFSPRELAFLIPWAASGLDRAALDRAFGAAGAGFRVLHRLTRGRFARAEAVAFRYA